jgi:PAS domain S-box-containing protein
MKTGRPQSRDHWPAAHFRSGHRSDRCRPHPIWATVVILAWASVSGAQSEPRQVMLLYSYERDFASHNAFATMFRPELSRSFGAPIDFIEVSLQAARLNPNASEGSIAAELQSTLPRRRLDLVVSIGGPAAVFAQTYRKQLFPTTPMLLAGVDRRFVQNRGPVSNDTAVAVEHDPPQMIETILRLLPDTRTVFVVLGASPFEQFWLNEMQREFRRFEGRLTFIWTNEQSFEEILAGSASLPPQSAILYGVLSLDAKGVRHGEERTLGALHAAANAPIFGLHSTQLGRGIVGGPLLSFADLSRNTATVAVRMLRGASQSLTMPTQGAATPTFDGRELRRWGIGEDRLLPGSVVLFREPTAWQRYRRQIIAGVTVASVQAAFAIALLASLIKRRRAERSLRMSEEGFRLLLNAAPVMIWSAGPDKQCTNVNRARLEFTGRPIEAELGDGWTEAVHSDDRRRCREIFTRAFDRGEPFRIEYRLRRHDGEYRWILDTGVPDGFAGYVGSAIDVTELKLASVALSGLSRRLLESHEEERAWIAKKLNEELCQRLTGLNLQLHSLSIGSRGDVNQLRARVEELCVQFGDLASEIQAIPDQSYHKLELLGLVASIRTFCQEMSEDHGVTIDFHHQGVPDDLPNDVALVIFRVCEEALGNAVRHAAVDRVSVSLVGSRHELRLDVADEGVGFDPEAAVSGHGLGLIGMRERLSLVDGKCLIESQPSTGTRIRARVPLRRSD